MRSILLFVHILGALGIFMTAAVEVVARQDSFIRPRPFGGRRWKQVKP
jgi:hypothetical protein